MNSRNLVMVLIMGMLLVSNTVWADINTGLAAYYSFDGNACDFSAYENHGYAEGDVRLTKDRKENENSAFGFDGKGDHIWAPHGDQLDLTDQLGISVWFAADKATDNDEYPLVNKYKCTSTENECTEKNAVVTKGFHLFLKSGRPHLTLHSYPDDVVCKNDDADAKRYDDGDWHHCAAVFEKNLITIYMDGQAYASKQWTHEILTNDANLEIGTRGGSNDFKGALDEVRIYDRGLTAPEILELFNQVPQPAACALPVTVYVNPDRGFRIPVAAMSAGPESGSYWIDFVFAGEKNGKQVWLLNESGTALPHTDTVVVAPDLSFGFNGAGCGDQFTVNFRHDNGNYWALHSISHPCSGF